MWAKGTQYLSDYHIWFSMFTRPSYSRFTRAQRLTCCLSFAVSYMAVNATWYQQMEQEYRGEFGLIDLSWRALAVGCITSVIVLPVNIALVFIFRRSKVSAMGVTYSGQRSLDLWRSSNVKAFLLKEAQLC